MNELKITPKDLKMVLVFIIAIIIFFPLGITILTKNTNNTFEEYPLVTDLDSVHIIVKEVSSFHGTTLIQDDTGVKLSISAQSILKGNRCLDYYAEPGDSIARKAMSDTLYLFKQNKKLSFEIQCFE